MLRPFVPSQDHDLSRRFYEELGFETEYTDGKVSILNNKGDSFILQDYYVKEWADNFVLQLTVPDAYAWWTKYNPAHVAERFGAKEPTPPALQPWGMTVGFVHDPAGVLWHIAEPKG